MAGRNIGRTMPEYPVSFTGRGRQPGTGGNSQPVHVMLEDIQTGRSIPAMPPIQANGLHEIRSSATLHAAAATGFSLALGIALSRALARHDRPLTGKRRHDAPPPIALQAGKSGKESLFWVIDPASLHETGGFYSPGLGIFAIAPRNLIRITPATRRGCLWAAGEIAATPGIGGFCLAEFLGNPGEIDLTASRRLMLRAARSHVPVIVLRHGAAAQASACTTRWLVGPAPPPESRRIMPVATSRHPRDGPGNGFLAALPRFHVTLEKCRNAGPAPETGWILEWNSHEQGFRNAPRGEAAQISHPAAAGQTRM